MKYELPPFLGGRIEAIAYRKWLGRKAARHCRRDRRRGNQTATIEEYKNSIHAAVIASEGRDRFTGEELDWSLISTYDNAKSKELRRGYKATFALLPTVDHIGGGTGPASFQICSWRTNDMKNDLACDDFVSLCRLVADRASASA